VESFNLNVSMKVTGVTSFPLLGWRISVLHVQCSDTSVFALWHVALWSRNCQYTYTKYYMKHNWHIYILVTIFCYILFLFYCRMFRAELICDTWIFALWILQVALILMMLFIAENWKMEIMR